jgi:hypothetical protein
MKEKKDRTHDDSDVCHFCITVSAVTVTGSLSYSILLSRPRHGVAFGRLRCLMSLLFKHLVLF